VAFLNITGQTTTVVDTGAGLLQRIIIPTLVTSATVKVYDGLSATGTVLLDTVTMPGTLLSSGPVTLEIGATYSTGITVVTAGATMPLTVIYQG
jgi:hypothetical protein